MYREEGVREQFLQYTPEDIERSMDIDFLNSLLALYSPDCKPINKAEGRYISLMQCTLAMHFDAVYDEW